MLSAVFNVAMGGLFGVIALWWGVMEALGNSLKGQQVERDHKCRTQFHTYLAQAGCALGPAELVTKAELAELELRTLPDRPQMLALSRVRALIPLVSAIAVLAVSVFAEMGIDLRAFPEEGARHVSLLACWLGLVLEVITAIIVVMVAEDFRSREAFRRLAFPT